MRRTLVLTCCALVSLSGAVASSTAPAAPSKPTVRSTLAAQRDAGAIDQATYDRYLASWDAAQKTLKQLSGRRFSELRAVLATMDALARDRQLVTGRLPAAFLTLDVNRQWWSTGPLLGYGARASIAGSELVWQSYPGQGLQLQWLATFGKANGLWNGRKASYDARLGALLAEATALAAPRAGGVAWEYLFTFDGGRPPWVSALAQGTALQAYTRASIRLKRPELMEVARSGLGIFRKAPPTGVAQRAGDGTHFLIYSFAPKLRVLNGFAQAVNGLHDYGELSGDPEGTALFAAGERRLRQEVPQYDTGAWSLYSQQRESDLGYHELLRDFLRGLCQRLDDDGEPDPAVYCDTADRFTGYLKQPPAITIRSGAQPRLKKRAYVRFSLSKVSVVTLTVRRDGKVVFASSVRHPRGTHRFAWGPPAKTGPVTVELRAADLAGNVATTSGTQTVAK